MVGGNVGFFAAARVVAPGLWEVESDVRQGGALAAGEAGANGDLAVINFP